VIGLYGLLGIAESGVKTPKIKQSYTLQDKVHLSPKTTICDAVLIEIYT
jgi:hypothetical protein